MTDHPTETTPLGDARLIPITDFTDLVVMDRGGGKLGSVKEAYIDKLTGRVEFIIAATGGFLGVGDKFHPIPFAILSYNHKPEGYVGAFTKKDLEAAPAYDREQLSGKQYGWSDSVRRYFDELTVRPAGAPR